MKFLYFILFIQCYTCFSQNDTIFIVYDPDPWDQNYSRITDTVITMDGANNVLVGTCILPWTHGQIAGHSYGLEFLNVQKSDCKSSGPEVYRAKDKINFIDISDSIITIDLTIYDNCCYEFLCDYEVDSDGNLNLIYHGYGLYCACDCCFGLVYQLKLEKGFDEFSYDKIKSVTIHGDAESKITVDY